MDSTLRADFDKTRHILIKLLHIAVIILSCLLLYAITYDTLYSISFMEDARYLTLQYWICIFFIFEVLVEWAISPGRLKRLPQTIVLLIICIPYTTLISHYHWHVSLEVYYLLRVLPLVRATTVLTVMWGIMQKNWVTTMFGTYTIILAFSLYVLSLLFYLEEHVANPLVYNYWQSLWFSVMQMNTCGSNINPMTPAGKIIGLILSFEGLVMFPVFTVYCTQAFKSFGPQSSPADNTNSSNSGS